MSGIAGFWNINGEPADTSVLERMVEAIAHRGPNGRGLHVDGPLALGFTAFHETPESVDEKQPWPDEAGRVWLTMDGRVDNREDLARAIESKGRRLRNDSDAELVLRAYQVWGEDCPAKIVGDFGFVLWDGTKERLLCARDFAAVRPFLYYHDGRRLVWASEPVAILKHPDSPKRPNEGMIGEYLSPTLSSLNETLYERIYRLEPGHRLAVDQNGCRLSRYWDPESICRVDDRSEDECAEGFVEVFKGSIRSRLRSNKRVGIFLSGGLDSASIACSARKFLRHSMRHPAGLKAFSWVFPGRDCDESSYIDEVVSDCGFDSCRVTPKPAPSELYVELAARSADFPGYPNGTAATFAASAALFQDTSVVLTGGGGDEFLTGSVRQYADFLASGQLRTFLNGIQEEGRLGRESAWRVGLREGVKPLFPAFLQRTWAGIRGYDRQLEWVSPEFAQRVSLPQRLSRQPLATRRGIAWLDRLWSAFGPESVHSREVEDQGSSKLGVVYRHPFLDRRVAEFCLSMPHQLLRRGGSAKVLLRQAMKDTLPESIRSRTDKAVFSHLFTDTLREHGGEEAFKDLAAALGRALSPGRLRMECRRVVQSPEYGRPNGMAIWMLWRARGLDLWLKSTF